MKKLFSIFFILLALGSFTQDNCFPEKPSKARLVNDFAQVFSAREVQYLETKLVGFNDTTSTQIAVVTVNSLCGYDKAQFAYEIGDKWGIGNAKFNNGIVLLFQPKTSESEGQVFIATGYGLEGVLPDAIGRRIVENEMIPRFKQNDIFGGIDAGVQTIIEITGGEYSAENYNKNGRSRGEFPIAAFFFIAFFVFIMFAGTLRRAKTYGARNNMGIWAALMLMGSMNNSHRGRYNDFSSGRGGFGGFGSGGSGGFGGFGGGGFGGGGAGGSW